MKSVVQATSGAAIPKRRVDALPGPRGLPWFGNLLQLHAGRAHRDVEAWGRQFGPFFTFRLGPRRFLGLTDHETIMSVLRDRPDGFSRSVRLEQVWNGMHMDPGLFISNGDSWQKQRRMVMAAFDPAHVKAYFPMLLTVTRRLQQRWQKAAAVHAPIDLRADLMRYTVDGVAGLAFGTDTNTLESDDDVIQNHLDKIFPTLFERTLAPFPYWRYIRLPADRRLDRSVAVVNAAVRGFVASARARLQAEPARAERPANLLEAMIVAADREGSGVGDAEIAGNVLTMLLAGEDTTANTLAWLIWLLQRHPAALARCRDEVRRAVPDVDAMTPESLTSLDYLEACINEAMRLKPVAPTIVKQALRDTTLGNVQVPAGTLVWCVLRHDTLQDRYFPQADAFEPERWLAGDAHGRNAAKRVAMPFGGGPRICPGRYLALLEMKMAMAMLLGRFDIQSVATADGGDPQEHMALTMAPVGLQMRLVDLDRST